MNGIRDALNVAGHPKKALPVIETEYGISNGADAFDRLMTADLSPTLVICGNDVLAAGALRRAQERGLSVPKDISITGFDDIELASLVTPRLTTVHVPHRAMGEAAAEALIAMSEESWSGNSLCLPTDIQMGETLTAPKP